MQPPNCIRDSPRMRLLEIVFISLLLCLVASRLLFRAHRRIGFALGACCFLVLVLHLAFEGLHWQMLPAYAAFLLFWPLQSLSRPVALLTAAAMVVLVAVSCVAAAVLPMFKLPAPTGPHAVGTRTLYFKDPTRSNTLLQTGPPTGRDLAVQLWYPAAPSRNAYAPYRLRSESELRTSYMSVIPTHSRRDAPLLEGSTPWHVLLFNPAWDSRRGQSTALMEELASHGYVVAAIDHPGRTGPIRLPDGRILPIVPDPDLDDEAHSSVAGIEASLQREVDKEAADDSFVLDQLASQNDDPASPFYRKLDTQRAGVLGHSIGAAVAADACALDPRLLAAFSMSAPFYGKVREIGLRKPYVNLSEEFTLGTPEELAHLPYANRIDSEADILDNAEYERLIREYGGFAVKLRGINHSSFSDKAYYSPLRSLSGEGETPRDRVQLILRQYALQFFGKTLKREPAPLFDHPTMTPTHPFPQVTQQYFPGTAPPTP